MINWTSSCSVIARPSRLGAVWLAYRTRTLIWGVAATISLLVTGLVWVMAHDPVQAFSSRTLTSADPVPDAPTPTATVFSDDDLKTTTDWSQIHSLQINDVAICKPLWSRGAIPRLESLTVYGTISDQQLIELCNLYDLKSLTLYGANLLTSVGMTAWKHESRLEYLRLLNFKIMQTSSTLEWPPHLRTLICDDPHGVGFDRLNEWCQLRQLECLSTRMIPPSTGVPHEIIEVLRIFPQLKRLFLIELPAQFPNPITELQKALPQIRVRPHAYEPIRVRRVMQIVSCGFLILVGMSVHWSSQFVSSARSLMPNFTSWHFVPIMMVLLGSALLSFVLFRWAGCSQLASAALSGLPILVLGLEMRLFNWLQGLTGLPLPGFSNWGILFPIVTFALIGFCWVLFQYGLELDWFVRGEQIGLAILIMVGAIWAAFDLSQWYRGLQRGLEESGGGDIPLSLFDMRGWAAWGGNLAVVRAQQGKSEGQAMRLFDARLEKRIEQLQRQKRRPSLAQWQVAGPGSVINWLQMTIAIMLLIGFFLYLFVPAAWSRMGMFAANGGFQLLLSGLLMPLFFIWQRRPMFAMELLRPQTRQNWVSTCFRGVAWEICPVVAVSLVFGLLLLWTGNFGDWSTFATGNVIAIIFGLLLILYAMGMWAITLHSRGAVSLVAALGWIIIVLCIVIPILLRISTGNLAGLTVLIPIMLSATAVFGIRLAFHSWMNWELGRNS